MWNASKSLCFKVLRLTLLLLSFPGSLIAQNNDCANASSINISSNGFGLGVFTSPVSDMSSATVQAGETFAPAILVAGQTQKSVWYKFTLPTHRAVRLTLSQNGTAIATGDIGFAIYKTAACLPANADISSKLTPIGLFGSTYHPCVDPGEYLVQVSSKASANGPIFIQVETALTTASYDKPADAYDFGTVLPNVNYINYSVECQSIEDETDVCSTLSGSQQYTKSTWHVFKTPAYFDYIGLLLSSANGYFTSPSVNHTFGYRIYVGDARSTPINSLTVAYGCDSLVSNGWTPGTKTFRCSELLPNTTYSIEIFYKKDFDDDVRMAIAVGGTNPAQAPQPVLSGIPSGTNALGILPSSANGVITTTTDYMGCNARFTSQPCAPALPAGGVMYNGLKFNLSTFFTFTLATTARAEFSSYTLTPINCGPILLMRLFRQDVTGSCSGLNTTNQIGEFLYQGSLDCLPAGTYTLQVLGTDSLVSADNYFYGSLSSNVGLCMASNLGAQFKVSIQVSNRVPSSKYDLKSIGAFDSINVTGAQMLPMVNNVTYPGHIDTFGCRNTVLPADNLCGINTQKAIYREFIVADSGVVTLSGQSYPLWYRFYSGDAQALAAAQGVNNFPSTITGLTPYSSCIGYYINCFNDKTCVIPGTYTLATFGNESDIGITDKPSLRFNMVITTHHNGSTAQNLGSIQDTAALYNTTTIYSDIDYYSCKDNAVSINGYLPCNISGQTATKAIYRQFYLDKPARIGISHVSFMAECGLNYYGGPMTLFSGKASDGLTTLFAMGVPWNCFNTVDVDDYCTPLPAGWYTLVSYGSGPSYANPMQNPFQNYGGHGSYTGTPERFVISLAPGCPGPKYNRPYKAAIDTLTGQPLLIKWGLRAGTTPTYPRTDTTYRLYKEYFNCTTDVPFSSHPIQACGNNNRIAYYVFRTIQESFIQVDTKGLWAAIYAGDVRTDSASFATATPIQTCLASLGYIEICKLQPGTYTLVVFASDNQSCSSIEPTIYIDQVGYSRFDHASKAYDFGVLLTDGAWHNGKPGDVNPLDPARAPSNDFFYCTTGSRQGDPFNAVCNTSFLSTIYNTGVNNALYNTSNLSSGIIPRRNLWYSFVVKGGGKVRVKVSNLTKGKMKQYPFAIYRSNVDGTLPFSQVVSSGGVDSTGQQGLAFINYNLVDSSCEGVDEIAFYREPCGSIPQRYYILVENRNELTPGSPFDTNADSQVEVSIKYDSASSIQPLFDHYSHADNLGVLNIGSYTGNTDNYSCATRDFTDPSGIGSGCTKTLWYKFTTQITGYIRYRINVDGNYLFTNGDLQLYQQVVPGDSTSNGLLQSQSSAIFDNASGNWQQSCIAPGTYYLILTGCGRIDEYVFPEVRIIEQAGDFCSAPVQAQLNGVGSSVASVIIDCHTIGTDYGEFNPTLSCPNGAIKGNYKTSWFKVTVTGLDTLDVTTFLTENTSALASEIKYRMMTGDCTAMQEQSCVQDAQTQNTYRCLAPGSYYIQVFTPVSTNGAPVTGSVELHLSGVIHAEFCAPPPACLSSASFIPQYDCTVSDSVTFFNYSTYGSAIQYQWNFGYNNQTSTEVAPKFKYPALSTTQTYMVTLTVTNSGCTTGGLSTYSLPITIPARPNVELGSDTTICTTPASLVLNAATFTGATYQWQNGSTASSVTVNAAGAHVYWVKVSYNGCIKRDTIRVNINPITKYKQEKVICNYDSLLLNSDRANGETYVWNTGSTQPSIYVSNAGLYINQVSWKGCIVRDSFVVHIAEPPWPNNDTMVCLPFQSFPLSAAVPGAQSYTWQNGSSGSSMMVNATGSYWVQVNFGSCSRRDTLVISAKPLPVIQAIAASTCSGIAYILPWGPSVNTTGIYRDTLHYTSGCDSIYRIVNLQVPPPIIHSVTASICTGETYNLPWGGVVNSTGNYRDTVKAFTGCDSLVQVVNLTVYPMPVLEVSKLNDIDCIMGTSQLSATGATVYSWSPAASLNHANISNPIASPQSSTMYHIVASSAGGCTVVDSILVNVRPGDASKGYLLPSAFTPNHDGVNDCFGIQQWGAVQDLKFFIYNRWGQLVFYTEDAGRCWDGTSGGKELKTDVFVVVIQAKTLCGPVFRKGTVALIR